MSYVTRRRFLVACSGLIVAVTLISLNGRGDSLSIIRNPRVDNQLPDTKFINGTVSKIEGDTIYVVDPQPGQPLTVKGSPHIVVWKGAKTQNLTPIVPGNKIFVVLKQQPNGTFLATQIYANLFNRTGRIFNLKENSFTLSVPKYGVHSARSFKVIVNPNTIIHLDGKKGTGGNGTLADVQEGRLVQVTGVELPDNSVQATRMYVYVD